MNAHFIYSLALILLTFSLCFWFRKGKGDREE